MKLTWNTPTIRWVYFLSALVSISLSVWSAIVQEIPNQDALYYLRAAELFSESKWSEGLGVYRWPFYSLLVSGIQISVGTSTLVAAQILNAALDCMTVVTFIALLNVLSRGRGVNFAIFAAAIILLHPRLTQLRPVVVRDHGFFCFLFLTLYFVASDQQYPRVLKKALIIAAILLATLFRVEALFLCLLVAAYYLFAGAKRAASRALILIGVLVISTLLVPGYIGWTSGVFITGFTTGHFGFDTFFAWSLSLKEQFSKLTSDLAALLPPSRNIGGIAYAGIVGAITIDTGLRALTFPIAILALLSFFPRPLMPRESSRLVLWFAGWQIPLLMVFAALSLFIDWRYAMAFAFVMTIPAVFTAYEAGAQWASGTVRGRLLFAATLLTIAVPWCIAFPRDQQLEYLREAGIWIQKNLHPDAKILINDARIAYFSGRPLEKLIVTSVPTENDIRQSNYVVVETPNKNAQRYSTLQDEGHIVGKVIGSRGRSVTIYQVH
ncbi:hypothetical protein [Afipia sp. P52-10]|uniref:hypothetical protein n=1 Tax=Afipia sp. P52-10 TaxID=1429916 RepID=UPI0004BA79FF|nr:hypothetical protein [Afipia sp. P52-10]